MFSGFAVDLLGFKFLFIMEVFILWDAGKSKNDCMMGPQQQWAPTSSVKLQLTNIFWAAESYISGENTWFILNWCGSMHDNYEILSPNCSHYFQWQGISKPEGKPIRGSKTYICLTATATATANQDQTNYPHYDAANCPTIQSLQSAWLENTRQIFYFFSTLCE